MSSRLIIALIIMLLAQGVQAHNFVTGKTVTPVYIQEGGELLLNSDDEIHYQKWNSTQLAGKVRIIQYIAGRKSAKKKNSLLIKAQNLRRNRHLILSQHQNRSQNLFLRKRVI